MTQHQSPLDAYLTTDIIVYPTSDELRNSPDDPLVFARARRCVNLYFSLLQAILTKHGHQITLDRIDHDPAIGWLIHDPVRSESSPKCPRLAKPPSSDRYQRQS